MTILISNLSTPPAQTVAPRMSLPKFMLHLEGLAIFITAIALYANQQGNWWMFALLLFTPDVAMVGYLHSIRLGAFTYNLAHTYTTPLLLIALSVAIGSPLLMHVGLILLAHIGMDRTVGYGLKYPTAFKDTHLGRV